MNHHIIYRQKAIITVSKESEAYAVQKEISDVIKNDLPTLLQQVFDSISPNGSIIRIDSLQLDLGVLPAQNTGQAFKEQVVEKIREAIVTKQEKSATEKGVNIVHKEQSLREAFLYFLEHGIQPWYMRDRKKEDWEIEMLQHFANEDWQKIAAWLQQNHQQQPVIIERLVNQFSNDFLGELISRIIPFGKEKWTIIYQDLVAFFVWLDADKKAAVHEEVLIHCFTAFLLHQQLPDALYDVVKTKFLSTVHNDHFVVQQQIAIDENIATDIIRKAVERLVEKISHKLTSREKKEMKSEAGDENNLLEDIVINAETDSKKQDKRSRLSADLVEKEPQYVSNCGIVLLHPFLEMYFAEFGLLQERQFMNEEARKHAVLLLHYLATGETEGEEWNLLLQKMVCGLSFNETLPNRIELTGKEKEESGKLLHSVINYCPPLKNTSLAGLRSTFLRRDGRMEKKENGWLLTIEQKTVDMLLDKLPWGFSTIKLPWLTDTITVDWC